MVVYAFLHWVTQNFLPNFEKWPAPFGVAPLLFHRKVLEKNNLYPAPLDPPRNGDQVPLEPSKGRPDDGYGTDVLHPTAACEGANFGRNCKAIPRHLRIIDGDPDVQLQAQRTLARTEFQPAGYQLNVMAAVWIQANVHDWVGHYDAKEEVALNKGAASGCPMASFTFKKTKERPEDSKSDDPSYPGFRTNWWDASFVYGNNSTMVRNARTFEGGKLKINTVHPNTIVQDTNGVNTIGDNKNSWLGVELLQEIFVKEHNRVADLIGKNHDGMSDQEIYDATRNVIAALVAKIHTVDWTVELLKTPNLQVGMLTNWYGLPRALTSLGGFFWGFLLGWLKYLPPLLKIVGKKKADNKGVPYCLTEEFVAVYRLHSLLPDGLILGKNRDEFIPFEELVAQKGSKALRENPGRVLECWDSTLYYPCGHLKPHNYPASMRNVPPTEDNGVAMPDNTKIDLAALDLYRDRERGILKFNQFRRDLLLKPYKSFAALTGENGWFQRNTPLADELVKVYGRDGIENVDLLVGSLYERKLSGGFVLPETSFIIFLLMASRRLDSDPYLNEYFTPQYYTETGLQVVNDTNGLKDLLVRHYPTLAAKIQPGNSAFKPYAEEGSEPWKKAIDAGVVPASIQDDWKNNKAANDDFFRGGMDEKTPLLR